MVQPALMVLDVWPVLSARAAGGTASPVGQVLLLLGMLMAVVALSAGVLVLLRGRLLGASGKQQDQWLETLRKLRERGELSDGEYRATRAAAVGQLAPKRDRPRPERPPPRPDPTERVAEPGFDLTGEPLPRPTDHTP